MTDEGRRWNVGVWAAMLILAGCQNVADEAATSEPPAAGAGYPSLHTVPPRPRLSYPVEQRRAIVDGLIADLEHARYTSQVIRYRTGLSTMPPPEPKVVAAVPPETEAEDKDPAASASAPTTSAPPAPERATDLLGDDDDLDSFMQDMLNERVTPNGGAQADPDGESDGGTTRLAAALVRPAVAPPEHARAPVVTAAASAPPPAPAKPAAAPSRTAERPPPEPSTVALAAAAPAGSGPRFQPVPQGAQIAVADGLIAIDVGPVAEPALAVGSIAFDPGSATLPAGVTPVLQQWLGEANAHDARVKIVAEAAAPALALDRARAIGLALVQGGVPADRIELSHADGARGDRARVFLASPARP